MRKQLFKGFCAALLLAFVIFVVCQLHGAREPTYQEKPLSFWVSQQQRSWLRSDSPSRLEADRAIRSIGTNALPFLLKWTAAKDAPLKKKLMALAKKQSLIKVRFHSAEEYHVKADAGFAALGALAKPAVSALIELLNQSDTMVRVAAEYDLMWIGPEAQDAVPVLVRCLNDSNSMVRFRATRCLRDIHMNPELAVPALIRSLGQPGVPVRETINALTRFGESAKPAVPRLVSLLESGDPGTRLAASHALEVIDPAAWPKASFDYQNLLQGAH